MFIPIDEHLKTVFATNASNVPACGALSSSPAASGQSCSFALLERGAMISLHSFQKMQFVRVATIIIQEPSSTHALSRQLSIALELAGVITGEPASSQLCPGVHNLVLIAMGVPGV